MPYADYLQAGYFDFQDSTVRHPNGPGTFPLIITRKTSNGVWTLTQTFSRDPGYLPSLTIKMTLKNNTDTARFANLLRMAEVSVRSTPADPGSFFEYTQNSVLAFPFIHTRPVIQGSYGFIVQTSSSLPVTHALIPAVGPSTVPDPCNPLANTIAPFYAGDSAIVVAFGQSVPAHKSISLTIVYKTM